MACVAYLPSSRSLLLRLDDRVTYGSRAPQSRAPGEVGNTVSAQTACAPAAYLRTYLAECPLTAFGARGWSVRIGHLAVAAGCQLTRPQWVVSGPSTLMSGMGRKRTDAYEVLMSEMSIGRLVLRAAAAGIPGRCLPAS
jgi:hypothetical protein